MFQAIHILLAVTRVKDLSLITQALESMAIDDYTKSHRDLLERWSFHFWWKSTCWRLEKNTLLGTEWQRRDAWKQFHDLSRPNWNCFVKTSQNTPARTLSIRSLKIHFVWLLWFRSHLKLQHCRKNSIRASWKWTAFTFSTQVKQNAYVGNENGLYFGFWILAPMVRHISPLSAIV